MTNGNSACLFGDNDGDGIRFLGDSEPGAVPCFTAFQADVVQIEMDADGMRIDRDLAIPMDDGIVLRADVYRPIAEGRYATIITYGPYAKGLSFQKYFPKQWNQMVTQFPEVAAGSSNKYQNWETVDPEKWVPHGYVCVRVDSRGACKSPGRLDVNSPPEFVDFHDAIEWAAALPWSNGAVGTVGQSYLGLVQYYAAPTRPPHLKVASPVSGPVTYFEDCVWRRGVFELGWMLAYFVFMARDTLERKGIYAQERGRLDSYLADPQALISPMKDEVYRHLPLRDWSERLKSGAPYFADYLRNWTDGPYWAETDLRPRCADVAIPMLHVGSWYDAFQYDTLAMYSGIRDRAANEAARRSAVSPNSRQTRAIAAAKSFAGPAQRAE